MSTQPKIRNDSLVKQALDECRNALLDMLGGLLRDFKFQDMAVIEATFNAAREQYEQLCGLRDRKTFDNLRSLTASRISLVHEDDLEFSIRISDLAQQLRESCELQLGQLHLRFMTLLDQDEAAPEQLPVGPETVGSALRALAAEAGLSGDERLRLLQDMRTELIRRLRTLYETLNVRLDALGIDQKSFIRTSAERNAERNTRAQSRDSFGSSLGGAGGNAGGASGSTAAGNGGDSITLDLNLAGALRERMIAWLEEQIASGQGSPQIARQLGRTELAGLLPEESKRAVALVEQTLDKLAANTDIPVSAHQALEGLRIPLLKLALRDASIVTDTAHPARLLVNALSREACELPGDAGRDAPQLNLIEAAVARLAREYSDDIAVIHDVLGMLEAAHSERMSALQQSVVNLTEAAKTEERNELARRHASKAIRALSAQNPPRTVQIFLEHYWCVLLRRTLMSYGDRSDEWKQALKVADGLIWSMQPKTDQADRDKLVGMLPRLVQHLQHGLDAIRVSPETRDRLLERFTTLHTDALHGRNPALTEPYVTAPPEENSRLDRVGGTESVFILRRPGYVPREADVPEAMHELQCGQLLRFVMPDGKPAQGLIAWIGTSRQIFLLQMRPDNRVMAIGWSEMTRQYAAGTLSWGKSPDLFADQKASAD